MKGPDPGVEIDFYFFPVFFFGVFFTLKFADVFSVPMSAISYGSGRIESAEANASIPLCVVSNKDG